jgi:hypothetical protein
LSSVACFAIELVLSGEQIELNTVKEITYPTVMPLAGAEPVTPLRQDGEHLKLGTKFLFFILK